MALHPLYLSIEAAVSDPKLKAKAQAEAGKLNALSQVDYEAVMAVKDALIDEVIAAEGDKVLKSQAFTEWKAANAWLPQYAAYLHLRKQFKTNDFTQWPAKYKNYSKARYGPSFLTAVPSLNGTDRNWSWRSSVSSPRSLIASTGSSTNSTPS